MVDSLDESAESQVGNVSDDGPFAPTDDEAEEFASRLMRKAATLSMVKIDRGTFLRTEIPKYCPSIDA